MTGLCDSFQRPINYLRVSVTDRCNLRCIYCMPASGVPLVTQEDILSYEEICTIVEAGAYQGIRKVRLTGGEPLVRSGLPRLVQKLARVRGIDDISLTTNGILLTQYATELKSAGLHRVNVSLDSLQHEKFRRITGGGNLGDVLRGMEVARSTGLNPVKINMVVMRGINDDEVVDFATKTITERWHVRFIERIPTPGELCPNAPFASAGDIRKRLAVLGVLEPCSIPGSGPAKYFRWPGAKGTIGFITPVSQHFCFGCNRLRLTADGKLLPCLLGSGETDLKKLLRHGISSAELRRVIEEATARKPLRHRLTEGVLPHDRALSQVGG